MPYVVGIIAAFGETKDLVFLGIVTLALLGVGLYYAARFMKGKLKVELSRDSARSEELLSGRVVLETKKPIHGLLKVALVGREKRIKRSSASSGNTKKWVEVYRYNHVLEETRDFEAGFQQEYSFDLLAPTTAEVDPLSRAIVKGMAGRIHWHVEAQFDAKGVDLYDKEKCHVTLQG